MHESSIMQLSRMLFFSLWCEHTNHRTVSNLWRNICDVLPAEVSEFFEALWGTWFKMGKYVCNMRWWCASHVRSKNWLPETCSRSNSKTCASSLHARISVCRRGTAFGRDRSTAMICFHIRCGTEMSIAPDPDYSKFWWIWTGSGRQNSSKFMIRAGFGLS